MRVINPENPVDQMRLNTGDYMEGDQYLTDAVYLWFYTQAGNNILEGSISALESIINNIALSPDRWTIGDSTEYKPTVAVLTQRLDALKVQRLKSAVPVVIGSDRKGWKDFDKAFK